ncbi:glycosyl transferase family 1 [Sphingobium sp. 22B]|uniref:TIGR03087 family PEP-CTERM/XrtA system glycosyltransferase n=1 Tax=unclassified Sphingobium TaxID=2611147 RepID=UPI000783B998|nr:MULTISPECIES: TIGR03087 family PEP-CTERM/XrtA system glycosyltransferase [unclassified Sphingobium]KXU32035.1 glycosyl transferase family 1 [Sphingobium sp. AM]KYC31789.1 glycosyl transferase family 1 [Sphingobium sp. 22B]OAP31313.1 glycosyl transferase family 1 [Sphingobium sp. 20006FA]
MRGDILFLCHRIPFPPDRGDKIRSYHLLERMAEVAPVHVGCFADDARDMGFAPDMAKLTASQCVLMRDRSRIMAGLKGLAKGQPLLVSLFDHPDLHRWVAKTLAERPIAAVVTYSAQMAHFVPMLPDGVRFVMDFVDFDSAKYAAYGAQGSGPMAWINRREGRMLLDFERKVAERADLCAFVSEAEAALFRRESGLGPDRIVGIDNGVALDFFDPSADFPAVDRPDGRLLVFTGQMDYRPNVEAVESFARETLPAIRARCPQALFAIVGRNPTKSVQALAALPGVIVTGAVPDVRGWLAAADVVVAPLRIARGIQNKLLEAMAMARPVVASPQAAEGIDARDGEHLLIAADPGQEAETLLALLADPTRAACLGHAARSRMEERYRWSATLAKLPDMLFGSPAAADMRAA